jgi:O-antigen/teichoic acid export membrane protein
VGLVRSSAMTLASRMTITLINIPISMIIARSLGAEGQGIYSTAITIPGLWASLGVLGLDASHLYYLARERRSLGPILANSLLLFLVLSLLLVPAYLLLLQPVLGERAAAFRPFVLISGLIVPLILARHLFLSLFLGLGKVESYNTLMVVSQLSLLVLVVGGLWIGRLGTGFVIAAYMVSLAFFLVPSVFWLRRRLTPEDRQLIRLDGPLFRRSLAYGLKGHIGIILTNFTYRFDTILVMRWLGASAQGFYSIAVLLAEKLSTITASVQFVLFPRISASAEEEANRITPLVCRQTLYWVAAAGLVMLGLGRVLIRLFYGRAFLSALSAYQILLPGIVALTVSGILSVDLSGRNRRLLPTVAMSIAFGVNLLLNFLLIRRLGIAGAAWASTAAYAVQSLLMAVFFWRVSGVSPLRLLIPGPEDKALLRSLASRGVGLLRGLGTGGEA